MAQYRLVALLLYAIALSGCDGEVGPRGTANSPLELIRFDSVLNLDPVNLEGHITMGNIIVDEATRPSTDSFLGQGGFSTSDELTGRDQFAAITDTGVFYVSPDDGNSGTTSLRSRIQFQASIDSRLVFFRDGVQANTTTISVNPNFIPELSASPLMLNSDSTSTTVTMSFEGLPPSYELPEGTEVVLGPTDLVCEKDNQVIIDFDNDQNFLEKGTLFVTSETKWPVSIERLDSETLTQNLKASEVLQGFGNTFTDTLLDSCTYEFRVVLLARANTLLDDHPEIISFSDNGSPPENDLTTRIISNPIYLTLDRTTWIDL